MKNEEKKGKKIKDFGFYFLLVGREIREKKKRKRERGS